jgi:hypothetical protein
MSVSSLRKSFANVQDEPRQGDFYVFSLRTNSNQLRHVRSHERFFTCSEEVPEFLRNVDLVGQLQKGDVVIGAPIRRPENEVR